MFSRVMEFKIKMALEQYFGESSPSIGGVSSCTVFAKRLFLC
jgi:hypothetical protein